MATVGTFWWMDFLSKLTTYLIGGKTTIPRVYEHLERIIEKYQSEKNLGENRELYNIDGPLSWVTRARKATLHKPCSFITELS